MSNEKLAIDGGSPAKTVPYGTGKRFTEKEEEAAVACLRSQKLWYKGGGTRVPAAEEKICKTYGAKHAITVSSGTAAVHAALAMCGVEAGDEVIVNPISDWGSVCGILALNAVPVFADLTDRTFSLDPSCVEKVITDKTRAIVLVHISGYPAHIKEIMAIAEKHDIKVLEDCAQSHLGTMDGKVLGTYGHVGSFAVSDAKHISCGEGGMVITDDEEMADIGFLFRDKAYARDKVRGTGDVAFLGFNYRMAELNAAVLDVQIGKLPEIVKKRQHYAAALRSALGKVEGFTLLEELPGGKGSYWFVQSHLDLAAFSTDRTGIAKALAAEGLNLWPALSPARTLYECSAIKNGTMYPLNRTGRADFLKDRKYSPKDYPVAERLADSVMAFLCSEFYTEQDAKETATGIKKVLEYYKR